MTDKVVIMVTAASRRECRKIARHLVEAKLAACVNITESIESLYRWEGKVADEKEFVLLIKSTRELFPEIKAEISKIHSYHTPEIIPCPSSMARATTCNGSAIPSKRRPPPPKAPELPGGLPASFPPADSAALVCKAAAFLQFIRGRRKPQTWKITLC